MERKCENLPFLILMQTSKANGYEYNLTLLAVAIGIAITGPGQYALDAFLF